MASDADAVVHWFDRQAAAYEGWDRWPWSAWREREAAAFMGAVGEVEGQVVLELGCGAGRFTRRLLAAGVAEVVVVDLSAAMLAQLPTQQVVAVQGDAATVDVGRRFRGIVSAGMLEFVADPQAVLANAARHAEPGATLTLLVPRASPGGRLYRAWHRRHGVSVRLFDPGHLVGIAESAGWQLEAVVRAPPFTLVARLRR